MLSAPCSMPTFAPAQRIVDCDDPAPDVAAEGEAALGSRAQP